MKPLLLLTLLLPLICGTMPAGEGLRSYRCASMEGLFIGLDRKGEELAAKYYIQAVVEEAGVQLICNSYPDSKQLAEDVAAGQVDVVIVSAVDYLQQNMSTFLRPVAIPVRESQPGERLVLKIRKGSGIKSLADLKGKSINLDSGKNQPLHALWLDQQLAAEGLPPAREFLSGTVPLQETQRAILPLFYGHAEAAVLTEPLYEAAVDRNAQLAERLVTLKESEPMTGCLLCVHKDFDKLSASALTSVATHLGTTKAGIFLLQLLKTSHFAPFKEEHLDSTKRLLAGSIASVSALPTQPVYGTIPASKDHE